MMTLDEREVALNMEIEQEITISQEEKQLLDAAKVVCQHFGQARGKVLMHKRGEREAEAALAALVHAGAQIKDCQYVRDLP